MPTALERSRRLSFVGLCHSRSACVVRTFQGHWAFPANQIDQDLCDGNKLYCFLLPSARGRRVLIKVLIDAAISWKFSLYSTAYSLLTSSIMCCMSLSRSCWFLLSTNYACPLASVLTPAIRANESLLANDSLLMRCRLPVRWNTWERQLFHVLNSLK